MFKFSNTVFLMHYKISKQIITDSSFMSKKSHLIVEEFNKRKVGTIGRLEIKDFKSVSAIDKFKYFFLWPTLHLKICCIFDGCT